MKPDLVIFDCDGVLVDTEPAMNTVMVANLARYGLVMTEAAAMAAFLGSSMPEAARRARNLGATLPPDADWIAEVYDATYARLREGVAPIPGVVAVLDMLDANGIPYCVASNGSDPKMDISLGQTGLAQRFAGRRFSAQTLGVAKPDPGLFLHAAKVLGVDPSTCVVIEDSATGAEGARRAGIRCFGFAPHDDGARLAAQGATIFHDMADLPALLGLHP